jgi:thioredoxin reductase
MTSQADFETVTDPATYDVLIVGGGPAGLNAALVLGRMQRRVLLCDVGRPRNMHVTASHGFLTRDGTAPAELRRLAAEQLSPYPTVELRVGEVERLDQDDRGFHAALGDGGEAQARRVILATGVRDELPEIEGLAERWGVSVFNCPYCDGWEKRGQPILVLGGDPTNVHLALMLSRFSDRVVLCTNGTMPRDDLARLAARRVEVVEATALRVEGAAGRVERVICADGRVIPTTYVFTHPPTRQASPLPEQLGLRLLDDRSVEVDDMAQTSLTGVFAAGDMARRPSMPIPGAQIVIAAAEGVIAAIAADQLQFLDDLAPGDQVPSSTKS